MRRTRVSSLIHIRGLGKEYATAAGPVVALADVDLEIAAGEFVAIMGPSGSGKSTFMNLLGCLDVPTHGTYHLAGADVATLDHDQLAHLRNRVIGFVFQGFNLIPRADLVHNVALPLLYAGVNKKSRLDRARALLARMGLERYGDHLPSQISGGQQQRVAIARALVNRPQLILADEPTGNLDSRTSRDIMELFTWLNQEEGMTIILVTHDAHVAGYARRRVHFVDGRLDRGEMIVSAHNRGKA
ncbi:MAG: ABC transporter ATP-binding protein [Magnetococcales bacterium]|nr:ABC transporter ATP-binding protein [Magnetococcales bacterium]